MCLRVIHFPRRVGRREPVPQGSKRHFRSPRRSPRRPDDQDGLREGSETCPARRPVRKECPSVWATPPPRRPASRGPKSEDRIRVCRELRGERPGRSRPGGRRTGATRFGSSAVLSSFKSRPVSRTVLAVGARLAHPRDFHLRRDRERGEVDHLEGQRVAPSSLLAALATSTSIAGHPVVDRACRTSSSGTARVRLHRQRLVVLAGHSQRPTVRLEPDPVVVEEDPPLSQPLSAAVPSASSMPQ